MAASLIYRPKSSQRGANRDDRCCRLLLLFGIGDTVPAMNEGQQVFYYLGLALAIGLLGGSMALLAEQFGSLVLGLAFI